MKHENLDLGKSKTQKRDVLDEFINTVPVNIERLIRSAGIELDKNAPQEKIGRGVNRSNIGEIRKEGDVYKILVLGSDHYYRKRFTMAHELGHFVLHKDKIDNLGSISDDEMYKDIDHLDYVTSEEEKEANAFAAETLMPENKVKEIFAETMQNHDKNDKKEEVAIIEMSKMFQVSQRAMKLRLFLLNLIENY